MSKDFFQIAGISVCVESDLPTKNISFKKEVEAFRIDEPGEDLVTLSHFFYIPDNVSAELGEEIYHKTPWIIFQNKENGTWSYLGVSPNRKKEKIYSIGIFSEDYSSGKLYHQSWNSKNIWPSLSLMVTDQIWLTPLLPDRQAFLIHSAAAIINGKGMVFVGHSEAGKSTTVRLLKTGKKTHGLDVEILCDDRNILRRWENGWRVHGTWSHGDEVDVSPASAPLQGVFFLQQDKFNGLTRIKDSRIIRQRMLPTLIKSYSTADWWDKVLTLGEKLIKEVPFFIMHFDKSGAILPVLREICEPSNSTPINQVSGENVSQEKKHE